MSRYIDAEPLEHRSPKLKALIEAQPTVDVVEVRHGRWAWISCTYDRVPCENEYICSCCRHKVITHGGGEPWEKYCPNCGAKMDGEKRC